MEPPGGNICNCLVQPARVVCQMPFMLSPEHNTSALLSIAPIKVRELKKKRKITMGEKAMGNSRPSAGRVEREKVWRVICLRRFDTIGACAFLPMCRQLMFAIF